MINDRGQAAFRARVTGGRAEEGIFLLSGEDGLRAIVTTAEAPPVNRRFTRFGGLDLNHEGQVAFVGLVAVAGDFNGQRGVFLVTGSEISKIAVSGDKTPTGEQIAAFGDEFVAEEISVDVDPLDRPSLNEAGEVSFRTFFTGDTLIDAILLHTPEGLQKVAIQGDPSPLGGAFLLLSLFPSVNNVGDVVFSGLVRRGRRDTRGVFVASQQGISAAARILQTSPIGGFFSNFSRIQINDGGDLLFEAELQKGSSPGAIFLARPQPAR